MENWWLRKVLVTLSLVLFEVIDAERYEMEDRVVGRAFGEEFGVFKTSSGFVESGFLSLSFSFSFSRSSPFEFEFGRNEKNFLVESAIWWIDGLN